MAPTTSPVHLPSSQKLKAPLLSQPELDSTYYRPAHFYDFEFDLNMTPREKYYAMLQQEKQSQQQQRPYATDSSNMTPREQYYAMLQKEKEQQLQQPSPTDSSNMTPREQYYAMLKKERDQQLEQLYLYATDSSSNLTNDGCPAPCHDPQQYEPAASNNYDISPKEYFGPHSPSFGFDDHPESFIINTEERCARDLPETIHNIPTCFPYNNDNGLQYCNYYNPHISNNYDHHYIDNTQHPPISIFGSAVAPPYLPPSYFSPYSPPYLPVRPSNFNSHLPPSFDPQRGDEYSNQPSNNAQRSFRRNGQRPMPFDDEKAWEKSLAYSRNDINPTTNPTGHDEDGLQNNPSPKMDATSNGLQNNPSPKMDATSNGLQNNPSPNMDATSNGLQNNPSPKMDATSNNNGCGDQQAHMDLLDDKYDDTRRYLLSRLRRRITTYDGSKKVRDEYFHDHPPPGDLLDDNYDDTRRYLSARLQRRITTLDGSKKVTDEYYHDQPSDSSCSDTRFEMLLFLFLVSLGFMLIISYLVR